MKINKILVSQPQPAVLAKSPFYDFAEKNALTIDYKPLIRVVGVTLKEFRAQRTEILEHSTIIFSSRTTIDSFFKICEDARITVPETMKYICNTEAVALYLQKYIVYRKRKVAFADGTFNSLLELIVKHKDEKFILALTEPYKPELPETLSKLKLKVSPVVFARTVAADMSELHPEEYDIIALYSPSDVKALVENFDIEKLPTIATFGEATLRAAKEAGLKVKASAPSPEAPSMVKALDIYCQKLAEGKEVEDAQVKVDLEKEEFIRAQQNKLQKKTRTRAPRKTTQA
ncbi:MAG: uroporphyrinogen-III synthase [Alistipes sp.]|nr:uroporphyrinogen-III synthase [Alistipes sp.]